MRKTVHLAALCLLLMLVNSKSGIWAQTNALSGVGVEALYAKGGPFEGFKPSQEIVSKRSKTSKYFRNGDGSYTLQTGDIYHYKDASGKWQDIILSIKPTTDFAGYNYANITNQVKSYFPASAGDKPILMQLDNNVDFTWWQAPSVQVVYNSQTVKSLNANTVSAIANGNKVTYQNIYPGISEEFEILKAGIENSTIIHELSEDIMSAQQGAIVNFSQFIPLKDGWSIDVGGQKKTNSFSAKQFHINIPGTDNGIYFGNIIVFDHRLTKEQALYVNNAPADKLTQKERLLHAENSLTCNYKVEFVNGGISVSAELPVSWLKQNGRSYPVTIDPTVTITPSSPEGNYYAPTSNWYGYQRHADLYLASEIGVSNINISAIEYNRTNTNGTNNSKPYKVYMRTTASSTLSSAAWNSTTYTGGLTALFDQSIDFHGTTSGWKMFTFTNPFLYTGDNLIVMVYDAYGSSGSAKYMNRASGSSVSNRQAGKRQDNSDPGDGSTMSPENYLPEIRITYTFTEDCDGTPEGGAATATTDAACIGVPFTLSLMGASANAGLTYQWYSSPAGENDYAQIPGATNFSYTVASQTEATDYYCEITCTNSGVSANSDPISVAQNPPTECYCTPNSSGATINTINHVTTTGGITNIDQSSGNSAYTDYSDEDTVAAVQGTPFNLSVAIPSSSSNTLITVWIDWNQNGLFTDPGEQVYTISGAGALSFNTTVMIPPDAVVGNTRMRIRSDWYADGAPDDPCNTTEYGETEDYTVNVIEAVPCNGLPNGGIATCSPGSGAPSTVFTASASEFTAASGQAFQWQSSPDGVSGWADLPSATGIITNVTAVSIYTTTYYRLRVICTATSDTAYSTIDSYETVPVIILPPVDTTDTICGGTFYDSGGPDGNYTTYENSTITLYPTMPNTLEQLTFTAFNTESNWDYLYIYDGNSTAAPLIGTYTGSTLPNGGNVIQSSASDGTLTIRFTSDGSGNYAGWTALMSCYVIPPCDEATFPDEVNTVASPSSLCISGDVHLNLSEEMPLTTGITYQWQRATTETGTYTNIGTASATPAYIYNTSTTYWYRCQIRCDGTTILTSTPVQVEAVVPEAPVVADGQHCGPGPVTLSGTVSSGNIFWYTDETSAVPIATGDSFTTPDLSATTTYYASAGAMPSIDTVVGDGTSTGSSSVSPFYHVWGGYKHQYLIMASDLQAAGITGGSISQIGFDVTSTNPNTTFNNFSISMGTTTDNSLTTYEPVTEVMAPTSITPTSGPFMIPLDNAFNWDGSSNLVIQICFSNENTGGTGVNVRYGSTSYTAHKYTYDDQTPVADLCTGTAGYNSSSNYLPNIYFHLSGCESERVLVTAYVRDTPSVDLGPDESLCGDANQSITLDAGNPGSTYLWNDGSANQTLTVDQSGTYYVTVTNEYGCVNSDTTHKDILIAPNVHLGEDTTICNGVTLTLNAGDDGTIYYWNTGAHTHTIDVNHTGIYSVIVTNDLNCTVSDTINVTVNGTLPTINSIIIDNTGPYTFQFTAFNPQGAITGYHWDFGDGDSSNEVSPVHTYQAEGNYQITLTIHTAMCGDLVYTSSTHIVGIDDISVDDAVLGLYPNPARDMITIENKSNFKMEELIITNAVGQIMTRQAIENGSRKQQVNLSGYATGIYSVRIKTDKGYVVRRFEVLK